VFSREMFKSRSIATISASLLFLDFMHFTMGRIATPETFAVFFNLASCLFFYDNYRSLLDEGKPCKSSILLGFLFFSLAFSTKWYTIFGLTGQLFLIFLFLFRNWRPSETAPTTQLKPHLFQLTSILLFSLFVSVAVYFSTFIPHLLMGHSFYDVYALQWKMYGYHSTLKAAHPFSSWWWSWPLNIRPLWLTIDNLREGWVSTVVAMGNPLIWWIGTFFARFIFTWLYNKTEGSILPAILLHVSANVSFEFIPTTHVDMILGALIAVFIIFRARMWEKLPAENPAIYRISEETA